MMRIRHFLGNGGMWGIRPCYCPKMKTVSLQFIASSSRTALWDEVGPAAIVIAQGLHGLMKRAYLKSADLVPVLALLRTSCVTW